MVILGYKTGQLGNRLFQYAHWMGNAWEYKYFLYNPSFDEYGLYFDRNEEDSIYEMTRSFLSSVVVRKIVLFLSKIIFKYMHCSKKNVVGNRWIRFYRIFDDEECNLRNPEFIKLRNSTKCLVVQGWLYRDSASFNTYAERIREFFRPLLVHERNIENLMLSVREPASSKIVIGLHMRGGDYKSFMGGRFYYTPEQYGGIMHKIEDHFGKEKVRWIVCSNETIDIEAFSAFDVMVGTGQIVEDMYTFSVCDYIVGPPSTYTGWASFYGNKPLYFIEEIEGEIVFKKITE